VAERPPYPAPADLVRAQLEAHDLERYTALPGRVQSYDASTQTADVVPLVRHPVPQPDGSYEHEELPVIPAVPVLWPRTGRWMLTLPFGAGDTVQLLVNTADIGRWRTGDGSVVDPGDQRRQHLAHAVAIPGLYTRARALEHASATELLLGDDQGTRLSISAGGAVTITTGAGVAMQIDADGTVHLAGAGGELVAMAAQVTAQLTALKTAIAGAAVVPMDGGAAFKAALVASLSSWPASVAATKTRAV